MRGKHLQTTIDTLQIKLAESVEQLTQKPSEDFSRRPVSDILSNAQIRVPNSKAEDMEELKPFLTVSGASLILKALNEKARQRLSVTSRRRSVCTYSVPRLLRSDPVGRKRNRGEITEQSCSSCTTAPCRGYLDKLKPCTSRIHLFDAGEEPR